MMRVRASQVRKCLIFLVWVRMDFSETPRHGVESGQTERASPAYPLLAVLSARLWHHIACWSLTPEARTRTGDQ